jgi:hypothetical protein
MLNSIKEKLIRFIKYLAWLEEERIKAMIWTGWGKV